MAEGAVVTSKAPPREALLQGRVELHSARRSLSSANASLGRDPRVGALNPSPGSHRPVARSGAPPSSMEGRRSNVGEFHRRGLDPELSFEITFRRIGAGLANLGNTCFLNSVLQCLTYTEPFAAYLKSGKHKSSCRSAGFCTMCALETHVMDALQSTGKILRPFHLVKNLRNISRNFRNSRQEDAHEYMVNLLESMHKCCLPSGIASESPSAYEKSLVHKIFGGRLRSQVKCLQCSYCSNKFDPFLDLSLEIMKADTLHKALSHFTAVEQLDGGERQYQCQRCKQKVRAVKQLTIHKAPYVLTVHLKRFGSVLLGQKINKKVDFEPTLDLKRYVSDPYEGDLKYTLYGVLVHAGYATHSGHYYCFVRTSSGMWYSLNDDEVFQVSEKTVLQQKAYMLFYVRNIRNSATKRAPDILCKQKGLANSPGAKDLAVCHWDKKNASILSPRESEPKSTLQATQDWERESGSKKCISIPKSDNSSLGVSTPVKGMTVEEHLLKKTSSPCLLSKTYEKANLSQEYIMNSLSKVSSRKDPSTTVSVLSSAVSEHLAAEGLIETAACGDCCNQHFGKDLVLSIVSKEKTVSSLPGDLIPSASASGTLILTNSLAAVDVVMCQARDSIVLHPSSHNPKAAYSLIEDRTGVPASAQHSHAKDGLSVDLTVNVDKFTRLTHHAEGNVSMGSAHGSVLAESAMHETHEAQDKVQVESTCKAHSTPGHEGGTLSDHPSDVGSTGYSRTSHVKCQDATVSTDPVAIEVLKCVAKERGQVDQINCELSTSSSSQKDCVGCNDSFKLDTNRKVQKQAYMRKIKFGPQRLFLAYLTVMKQNIKKKKHQRIKKERPNIRDEKSYRTLGYSVEGDEGISTSLRFLDVGLVLSTKRKTPESLWRRKGLDSDADLIHSTKKDNSLACGADTIHTDSMCANESCGHRRCMKDGAEIISNLEGQQCTGEPCIYGNSDHVSRSLLVRRSREMIDSPLEVASTNDDEPESTEYKLNKLGQVCERGKEVKRTRMFFGRGSHFRDAVASRTQKRLKIDRATKPPFRIRG